MAKSPLSVKLAPVKTVLPTPIVFATVILPAKAAVELATVAFGVSVT